MNPERRAARGSVAEVFAAFLRLGLTSFGGPVAHLGYFRADLVERRAWVDSATYADLVALCQFLPGPASSQVAVGLGIARAGLAGGCAAWIAFTAPSAVALTLFALGLREIGNPHTMPWLHGLKIVAVAVVALAVWAMAQTLCPDRFRRLLAASAAIIALLYPTVSGQLATLIVGGALGAAFIMPPTRPEPGLGLSFGIPRTLAVVSVAVFAALLAAVETSGQGGGSLGVLEAFYRSGSLVFGGGHVVLALLQRAVVPPGWIGNDAFLAGYGAAQAVPGPLFTFAAYLGAAMRAGPGGAAGALLCLVAIYLPSFLLLLGVLPFWNWLRRLGPARAALAGVNAAVVGLLLAALYTPVWTSAIAGPRDAALLIMAVLALTVGRAPPWAVVIGGAALAAVP